ncbi:MAG TPA: 3D domain-containing protein [Gemmatimonadaceae bacterium]|jgi:3D (Asp-Asp-Asp) domain-containing protein|nr:3D domain-containing protein [Gemmatimonadaceae bacterium]
MKNSNVSRGTYEQPVAGNPTRSRADIIRTAAAVTLAVALLATGAIALPSLSPVEAANEIAPANLPQLEPQVLADIEGVHSEAGMLTAPMRAVATLAKAMPSATVKVARATTAVTKPIAKGVESIPRNVVRATAHEAIKMKKGILPLIPSKFARAQDGVVIPVSLTQYCVQGETRRGRQTRHGIVAADPRIFPLSRYVEVFLGNEYLGRYLVDDTGGNVLGATLDIWNPDCREAARFGRHWGSAILVAREVESVPNDTLVPTRWDGLAKR